MANSLPPILVPAKSAVDIYAVTGITVGVQITIQNIGDLVLRVHESSSDPTGTTIGYNKLAPFQFVQSADTPVGSWVTNTNQVAGLLQVSES